MTEPLRSDDIAPLTNGPRDITLAALTEPREAAEDAERLMFTPRRLAIRNIETNWQGLVPTYTVHLEDGAKIVFNPLRPGPFVLKRGKNYVRALYPKQVRVMDGYAALLSQPRFILFHRWLKWIFPIARALGIHPARLGRVFKMDQDMFLRFYKPLND